MAGDAQDNADRFWLRNEVGRVWGPFGLEALGRVNLGQRDGFDRIQASTDGQLFRPVTDFPLVKNALERAAAATSPPRRPAPQASATPVGVKPLRPAPPPAPVVEEDHGPPASGTLETLSSIALYARIAGERASGRLEVQVEQGPWVVYFKKGTPERIEPHDTAAVLASFLVQRGAASQADIDHAFEITGGDPGELLDGLVSLQLVAAQDLFGIIGDFATAQLHRFIGLEAGSFTWDPATLAPQPAFPLGARWQLLSQAMRALPPALVRRRLGDRGRRAIYPSSGGRVRVEELGLTAQEARVAHQFDGTKSPELMARDLPGEREIVMRTALLLGDVGCMSFGPELDQGNASTLSDDVAPAMEKRSAFEPSSPAQPSVDGNVGIGRMNLRSVAVKKDSVTGEIPMPPKPAAEAPAQKPPPPRPTPPRPAPVAPRPSPAPARSVPVMQTAAHAEPRKDKATLRALLDKWRAADHFEVLGIARTAKSAQVKTAYFALARSYHPDTVLNSTDPQLQELHASLTARLNEAYAVLGDDEARATYAEQLASGGTELVDVGPLLKAEEDYLRATIMVKARKYAEALALLDGAIAVNPKEPDFLAWRAWARFVSASDKNAEYARSVAECQDALKLSEHCSAAHLFIGQMSKIVGEQQRAERAFKAVLAIEPDNIEARRELRLAASRG